MRAIATEEMNKKHWHNHDLNVFVDDVEDINKYIYRKYWKQIVLMYMGILHPIYIYISSIIT